MNPEDFRPGIYRHYKGPVYLALGLAHDANAGDDGSLYEKWDGIDGRDSCLHTLLRERVAVIYIGLQLDAAHTGPRLAVRTLDDFVAVVCAGNPACPNYGQEVSFRADTCVHCGLPTRQRFIYIGQSWEGQ